jgi:hypothetical protein
MHTICLFCRNYLSGAAANGFGNVPPWKLREFCMEDPVRFRAVFDVMEQKKTMLIYANVKRIIGIP